MALLFFGGGYNGRLTQGSRRTPRLSLSQSRGRLFRRKASRFFHSKIFSSDKENAYFAQGVQDEILTKLAGIADLKVISRTSTQNYQAKPDNLGRVSQELGVATVLEGTVQTAGDRVRVNVQLIDAQADSHLWARSFDGDAKDIFSVESKVAQE